MVALLFLVSDKLTRGPNHASRAPRNAAMRLKRFKQTSRVAAARKNGFLEAPFMKLRSDLLGNSGLLVGLTGRQTS